MHSLSFPSSSMFSPRAASLRRASKKHASMKRAAHSKREGAARESSTRVTGQRTAKPGVASLPIAHPSAKVHASRQGRAKGMLFRSPEGDVVQVRNGFSWGAFLVGSSATALKRLWPLIVAGVIAFLAAAYVDRAPLPSSRGAGTAAVAGVFYFAYMVFCGIHGNRWLMQSLRRRGYIVVGEA